MGRIEAVVGANYSVGNKLSLADVTIYNVFAEYLKPNEQVPDYPQWKAEPFASKARMDATLASFPKLKSICDTVANNEGIIKYLAVRGVQYF